MPGQVLIVLGTSSHLVAEPPTLQMLTLSLRGGLGVLPK